LIKGFPQAVADRLISVRSQRCSESVQQDSENRPGEAFASVDELARAADLSRSDLEHLAAAGALSGLAGHRHRARWQVAGVEVSSELFATPRFSEAEPMLRAPTEAESLIADYRKVGLSLGRHPLALLRKRLGQQGLCTAADLQNARHGALRRCAGLVINRQRPGTASGVIFMTLEDETGYINLVVWPWVVERQRREVLHSRLLVVYGKVEKEGDVVHLVASRLIDRTPLLGRLQTRSRDFS
jgi:error-prone DNA polymerase